MTKRDMSTAARTSGLIGLAMTGLLSLAACEEHPYPSPAPDESAPPAPRPSQLMGAPDGSAGPAPGSYADGAGAQPYGAPQPPYTGGGGYPPPPAGGYGQNRTPCPPDASHPGLDRPPAVITCNAPIPNPSERGDGGYDGRHHHHHHHHHHQRAYGYPPAPAPEHHGHRHLGYGHEHEHHRHHHHHGGQPSAWTPVHPATPPAPTGHHHHHHHRGHAPVGYPAVHPVPSHRPAAAHPAHHLPTAGHPGVVHVKPKLIVKPAHVVPLKPHLPALRPQHLPKVTPAPAANTVGPAANTVGEGPTTAPSVTNSTGPGVGDDARYAALQSALASDVAREATLNAPSHFDPNQSVDVSLTLPSDFAQTFQGEAAKQNLSDSAASVNMTAKLSGDGFSVTPDEPQSQPLTLGQGTVFRWKVTPQTNAKGPLEAQINADVLSQGRSLPLGSVKSLAGVGKLTGRVIGVSLLVVIALVLLGWAAQRRRPTAAGATRPNPNHRS